MRKAVAATRKGIPRSRKNENTAEIDPRFSPVVEAFAKDRQVTYGKMFASMGLKVSNVVNSTPTSRADYEKQTPMARIAKSEEVAAAATWLCSDAASYVTGAVLPVDGGMTL